MSNFLQERIETSAFALRGYNITNLGRSAELLEHPAYGSIVEGYLKQASGICSEATGRQVDLVQRVRRRQEGSLKTFADQIAMILAMEQAQIVLLREFFGVEWSSARVAFGYSLGEIGTLIAAGVYEMENIPRPLLALASDCAELGKDVRMGVLFTRDRELDQSAVRQLCVKVNNQGRGVIGISAFLSPNAIILMGQANTIDQFKSLMPELFPKGVHLRKNPNRWPPLHTPILWERNLPNRAAVLMHTMEGGFKKPVPPIISMVTGKASYNEYNSRDLLNEWIDHPQHLWDAVCETLAAGVDTVIHVGPEPNLIPATFRRLSEDVRGQLRGRSLNSLGLRAISGMARRPWLTKLLSTRATLLRAPFVEHIILEDWLLEQKVP